MIRIANSQFWVHDQDEALNFYIKTLGWEVRGDVTMEGGHFRWLVVAPPAQGDMGLVLMPVPGPPMLDAEASAAGVSSWARPGRYAASVRGFSH